VNLDWTRVSATETATTRYVARTAESSYAIVGRDVLVASVRGGAVTVRRFQAYEIETGAAIGSERDRLSDAKREVSDYLDELADVEIVRTPLPLDVDDEDLVEGLARAAAAIGTPTLDPTTPVTVAQAMDVILHVARKLDTGTAATGTALGDLADLTRKLADAIGARAAHESAMVVADQHADAAEVQGTDMMRKIADASADTVRTAAGHAAVAHDRLATAIVAYGTR
jgi:hypothetical protein